MYNNSSTQSAVDGDQDQQKVVNEIWGTRERGSHSSIASSKAIAFLVLLISVPVRPMEYTGASGL